MNTKKRWLLWFVCTALAGTFYAFAYLGGASIYTGLMGFVVAVLAISFALDR